MSTRSPVALLAQRFSHLSFDQAPAGHIVEIFAASIISRRRELYANGLRIVIAAETLRVCPNGKGQLCK